MRVSSYGIWEHARVWKRWAVGVDRSPSTVRQQRLIKNILEVFPETKDYLEYEDYMQESSKTNASEFIDAVMERNIDRIGGIKNLVKYYAERPGAEKFSSHGLFSQTDDKIDLDKVAEEISKHQRNYMDSRYKPSPRGRGIACSITMHIAGVI